MPVHMLTFVETKDNSNDWKPIKGIPDIDKHHLKNGTKIADLGKDNYHWLTIQRN